MIRDRLVTSVYKNNETRYCTLLFKKYTKEKLENTNVIIIQDKRVLSDSQSKRENKSRL